MSDNGKILVTGATGNVSSAVIANLVDRGAKILGLKPTTLGARMKKLCIVRKR